MRFIADHVLLGRILVVSSMLGIDCVLFELRVLVFLEFFAVFNSISWYSLLIKSVLLRRQEVVIELMLSSRVLTACRPLFIVVRQRLVFGALCADNLLAASSDFNLIRISNGLNRFV